MRKQNRLRVISSGIAVVGAIAIGGYLYCGDAPRLKRGIAHYEDGAYSEAYVLLHPLAKKGYAEAQLLVGDCLATGRGVLFEDAKEAMKWYRAAANQGLPKAQHRLFACYRDGIGCERNRTNAAKWCRKAAEAGLDEAMYDMGLLYLSGIGVEANAKSAFKWFHRGAELGNLRAIYMVGVFYRNGTGVEQDADEAARWQNKALESWRQCADAGDVNAMLLLARLAEKEDCDKEEASKWYRKAAEKGNAAAQFKLALCYFRGDGVEEDAEVAAQWMLKAAEQGADAEAQWFMGCFYQKGKGVEQNPAEAVKWFSRSAKKNWPRAKHSLALCYWRGDGVQKDEAKAERLLEEAAGSGNADASDDLRWIRDERAKRKQRLAQEKAEKEQRLVKERADKKWKIETLLEIEADIAARKERINNILKGKMKDDWDGFDAQKARTTDASISTAEEPPQVKCSASISETSEMQAIDDALVSAQKDAERLEAREQELARVKDAFTAKEQRLAKERADKEWKIEALLEIEADIAARKERINNILKGKMTDDWDGFDAPKAKATDASISTAEEPPQVKCSASISETSEMQAIDDALVSAQKDAERLEAREQELARVKDAYAVKELESRKMTCVACGGAGTSGCTRCEGKGLVIVKERTPCPTCAESIDCLADRKGQVQEETVCQACRGKGEKQSKCVACSGSGRLRIRYVRGGSLRQQSAFATCNICGGSGKTGYRTCVKCAGSGKVDVWKTCKTCHGRGEVTRNSETTCPSCNGKTRLECTQCNGTGFTYRPKQ